MVDKLRVKNIICLCLLFFLLSGVSSPKFAARNTQKPIPPEIKRIDVVKDLIPYLDSESQTTRIFAVRRLGEIGGPEAINLLIKTFEKEPYLKGLGLPPGVHGEVLISLGKINLPASKNKILSILKYYIDRGPNVKGPYHYYDSIYCHILREGMNALSNWKDEESSRVFLEIFLNKSLNVSAREEAYAHYLELKLIKDRKITPKAKCDYLLDILLKSNISTNTWYIPKGQMVGTKPMEAIKNGAIEILLKKTGGPALPYLTAKLQLLPKSDSLHIFTIQQIIDYIHFVEERKLREGF